MTEPRDEKNPPDEPEEPTTEEPRADEPTTPAAPPTAPAPPPAAAEPVPGLAGPAPTTAGPAAASSRDRVAAVMGSRWLPPLATGLVGLLLGLMIGVVGMGLIASVAFHHGPRGHHGPGDGRGHHWQDDRPPPRR